MDGSTRSLRCGVGVALVLGFGLLGGRTAPPAAKIAFVGPISGPLARSAQESLAGVKAALEVFEKEAGVPKPALIELDDGDEVKKADAAFENAKKQKAEVVIAAATGVTVETYVAKARKAGLPLMLVGSAGPGAPSIAADEPVAWLGTSAVEQAITIGTFLEIPGKSKQPAFIVEETARGKELWAALERNLGHHFKIAGNLFVPPHAALPAAALTKLKEAAADRLVLLGEPDLVDATADAIHALQWKVPLFITDGMASAAASSLFEAGAAERLKGTVLLDGHTRLYAKPASELLAVWKRDHTAAADPAEPPPRTLRAFDLTRLILHVLNNSGKKPKLEELVTALLDERYGEDENKRSLLDVTHRSARHAWTPWKLGPTGPIADDATQFYDPDFGPLLRVRPVSMYQAVPDTKVVWIWYGDAYSKAVRSIEEDLRDLGLITHGYDGEFDRWVLDELLARAFGKINKLFLKNEDGTFIPGVSFAISFTNVKPEGLKENEYWRAVIAGDDAEAGGRAWPGEGRCEIYSTFMKRTIFLPDALVPPITGPDRRFLDGKYVWATSTAENLRVKTIRNLIDGYAGSFALTGAHELGHIIGLDHDEADPRSIMNVTEGAGLRETSACWIPEHVEIMERVLGRYGVKAKKKK